MTKVVFSAELDVDESAIDAYKEAGLSEEEARERAIQDEIGHSGVVVLSADTD